MDPIVEFGECGGICAIVDQQSPKTLSVHSRGYRTDSFLAGSVPKCDQNIRVVDFEVVFEEVSANGRVHVAEELVFDEPFEEHCFADGSLPHYYHLDGNVTLVHFGF